jgi:hypothetical protein
LPKLNLSHRRAAVKKVWWFCLAAVSWGFGLGHAHAQAVYKCNSRSYSEQPCSSRVVRTYEAPVPVSPKPRDVVVHRLPGESADEFSARKRRAGLSETDRDECARLDKRIPVEQERLKSLREEEVDDAQSALTESRRRFRQLRC